ncbi:MAG: energy transducer TonB [Alphaproteobacteria bacterium]|nr:energy transducer TonB [Alphaproteobacteria bacterium]
MTPLPALRAISLPPALLLSLAAHAALIAAIVNTDDAPPAPLHPGGVIAVEIIVEGPKSHPGVEPAPPRAGAPMILPAASGQPVHRVENPRPAAAKDASPASQQPALPPRARRKPLHFANTGVPLEKPAAVTRLPAHAARPPQPDGPNRPVRPIGAALTPAAQSSAGDRGASPRGENPKPPYPFVARRRGQEGQVLLNVNVLPDGTAGRVEIARSSGFRSLDEAARHAVALWRFRPARQNGTPVAARVTVPVRFSLH